MTDIHPQLAMLLGRDAKDIANIRKTCEVPPRVSVIDVTMAITRKDRCQEAKDFRRTIGSYPEVKANCPNLKFKGSGQRDTPVTDATALLQAAHRLTQTALTHRLITQRSTLLD